MVTLDRNRVAELIVTYAEGERRGSGYRATAGSVLTVAHVLADAVRVEVRFESDLPNEWSAVAVSWWTDADSDLAVVSIEPRLDERSVVPVQFGQIGDRAAVLTVHAVGFPRWKMRTYTRDRPMSHPAQHYRDACHVVGSVAVLSNWREGTLEVTLSSGPAPGSEDRSAWEGMSGAALWVGDRIVGIIARHHGTDGSNRLAAVRIDRAYGGLSHTKLTQLRKLIPLPELSRLPDVIPESPEKLITNAYQAQLSDIAPVQLLDRDAELDELVSFCAGMSSYAWWQGAPWAGKSALLSWFATHPPAGVDVVSFFITSRFAGQSDSEAFTDALIEQLTALAVEPLQPALEARARRGHLLRLLHAAADRCAEAGRRLLLVVDGLDEDTRRPAGVDRPSIASLLPCRVPNTVRVLVASRSHPDLPDDVRADHPLRKVVPRPLAASPHAGEVESVAKDELMRLLHGPSFGRDVLGLVAASGGGLTCADLEELTGRPPYELDALLGGLFGRSVGSRIHAEMSANRPPERVYLFAHETLHAAAERQFGASLNGYRTQLHAWACQYQMRRWPADTPIYLFRGYPRLLAATGDVCRLSALATDRARHNRMLDVTGGDSLGFAELSTATSLLSRDPAPDLCTLLLVALAHDELVDRNRHLPVALPAVWAALGQPTRALALANGIVDLSQRAQALCQLASVLATGGSTELAADFAVAAEAAADDIADPYRRGLSLSSVAVTLVGAGFHDQAERLARQVSPFDHGRALTSVAVAFASAGRCDRAAQVIGEFIDPRDRVRLIGSVVTALAVAGFCAQAEQLAGKLSAADRVRTLGAAAMALAGRGNHTGAVEFTVVAEAVAHGIHDPRGRAGALSEVVIALTGTGLSAGAERVARQIEHVRPRIRALSVVALALVDGPERDRAIEMIRVAENTARQISSHNTREQALGELAVAFASAGLSARARRLTDEVAPFRRFRLLSAVSVALAGAGRYDEAEELARQVSSTDHAHALAALASALTRAGYHARAERLAGELGPVDRVRVLSAVALELAGASDHDRAGELTAVAEAVAREIRHPPARATALGEVAVALAGNGEAAAAERLTRLITDPHRRAGAIKRAIEVLAHRDSPSQTQPVIHRFPNVYGRVTNLVATASAAASGGDRHRALDLADAAESALRNIVYPQAKVKACVMLLTIVAGDGDRTLSLADAAEAAAHEIVSPGDRGKALSAVAIALAGAGFPERAARMAVEAEANVHRVTDHSACARALVAVVAGLTDVGDLDRAQRLTETIGEPAAQAEALAAVVAGLVATGDLDRAERLAGTIRETGARAEAFAAVATGLAATGSHDRAVAVVTATEHIVRHMPDFRARALVLAKLAVAQAGAGDRDVAADLALAAEAAARAACDLDPDRDAATGVLVAVILARAGKRCHIDDVTVVSDLAVRNLMWPYDRAERLARALENPGARAEALTVVAVELARLGFLDRAATLATAAEASALEVAETDERAWALGVFVSRITGLGEQAGSVHSLGANGSEQRRLLVQVTGTLAWWSAIPAVSRVDLPALRRFCDVLLDDELSA
jgi:hypothetical protein